MSVVKNVYCPVFVEEGQVNVTSPFSPARIDPIGGYVAAHNGVDITRWVEGAEYQSQTATICAYAAGKVCKVAEDGSRGCHVGIDHGNGWVTWYFHLAKNTTRVVYGQKVEARQPIGYMGNTGHSAGAHLHFQLEKDGEAIDGLPYLLMEKKIPEGDDMTYEEFLEYMWKYEAQRAQAPATDAAWAKEALAWAKKNKIMQGDESGNLMPRSYVTREQIAAMLRRAAKV